MKKNKFKQLSLNKTTIVDLNKSIQETVKAGYHDPLLPHNEDFTDGDLCENTWNPTDMTV